MPMRKIEFSKIDKPEAVNAGGAPILQWLDVGNLVVDETYQRDLKPQNWKAIRKIAANFKWSMFSPVFVAPVEGGAYAIIDGQHRTHAAAICGFKQVPCQIVHMTQSEQAAAFAAVNGVVTAVTYHQLLKAALAAGEEWAVNARDIAKSAGCRLMTSNRSSLTKKPGEIFGVKGFLSVVQSRPRGPLIAALKILMSTEGYNDNREIWENTVLMPLLMALTERPAALANPDFSNALSQFDIWDMIDRDHQARRAKQRVGERYPPKSETWRAGVLQWLDKTFPARMALPAPEKLSRQATLDRIGKIGSSA